MVEYQVIARKFRPKTFKEVLGQEAIVTTLKNALAKKRLAQAYLFCGSRGTGKTTLARLLAKALNCHSLTADFEPCNQCTSCKEIAAGNALDVIEIDGASHRGIEDIRQINEAVCLASGANYKIYIIDEVHMLTKEAFNALLKTLEEPPPNVKFLFATTEPHKVIPTILSRCQRFNLGRIPSSAIVKKLSHIAEEMNVTIDEAALYLIANRAEGGLRDAESLFDQILSFAEGPITTEEVTEVLGLVPQEIYFDIDLSGKSGNLAKAFEISHQVFTAGKELSFFIEGLITHLRQILLVKLLGNEALTHFHSDALRKKYEHSAGLYSREQCLDLVEYLLNAQNQMRFNSANQITLEAILLHVMRSHFRISIEQLVRRLSDIEQMITQSEESKKTSNEEAISKTPHSLPPLHEPPLTKQAAPPQTENIKKQPSPQPQNIVTPPPARPELKAKESPPLEAAAPKQNGKLSIDPTPSLNDLGKKEIPQKARATLDTLMHFAAVELEGKLQKKYSS